MERKLNNTVLQECKEKLIFKKKQLLNRMIELNKEFNSRDVGRDEVDQSMNNLEETTFLATNKQLRFLVAEIDSALNRIQVGKYGICEETEEEIEVPRLMSIPWTRLSIEGAEIREDLHSRFAQ